MSEFFDSMLGSASRGFKEPVEGSLEDEQRKARGNQANDDLDNDDTRRNLDADLEEEEDAEEVEKQCKLKQEALEREIAETQAQEARVRQEAEAAMEKKRQEALKLDAERKKAAEELQDKSRELTCNSAMQLLDYLGFAEESPMCQAMVNNGIGSVLAVTLMTQDSWRACGCDVDNETMWKLEMVKSHWDNSEEYPDNPFLKIMAFDPEWWWEGDGGHEVTEQGHQEPSQEISQEEDEPPVPVSGLGTNMAKLWAARHRSSTGRDRKSVV